MKQLGAVAAILIVAAVVAAGYEGGRWIGSLVDIGFEQRAPLANDGAAEDGERARAQAAEAAGRAEAARRAVAEAARRAAAEARRAAGEAVPPVEERVAPIPGPQADAADAELAMARCGAWATMTDDDQLRAVEALVGHVLERVRVHQQLPEGAEASVIIAGARASIDKGCQGSPEDQEIVVIARWLYGGGN